MILCNLRFAFERVHLGTATGLKILLLDSSALRSSILDLFKLYIYFNFHHSTFNSLEVKRHLFSFHFFCRVIMFSFNLLKLVFKCFFLCFFYDIMPILCPWSRSLGVNPVSLGFFLLSFLFFILSFII